MKAQQTITMILMTIAITSAQQVKPQENITQIISHMNQCQKMNTLLITMTLGIAIGLTITVVATLLAVGTILARNSKKRTYHFPEVMVHKSTTDVPEINNVRINEYNNEMF